MYCSLSYLTIPRAGSQTKHRSRAFQAEELEQPATDDRSEKQGTSNPNSTAPHGSTEATGGGRGHMMHRMSPPQHPLPRPPGHPPRPFAGPSRGAGAGSGGAGVGEGGMGALLGVASQLRPPRVRVGQPVLIGVGQHLCVLPTGVWRPITSCLLTRMALTNELPCSVAKRDLLVQIDTNSGVKRETSAGNASLSQLLLTSPFSSSDGPRFTPNDALGQPSTNPAVMGSSAAPAGEVSVYSTMKFAEFLYAV